MNITLERKEIFSSFERKLSLENLASSIVNGDSGALNYLVIIIAKGWLLRSFQDGILAQSEWKSLIIPSPLFLLYPSFFHVDLGCHIYIYFTCGVSFA